MISLKKKIEFPFKWRYQSNWKPNLCKFVHSHGEFISHIRIVHALNEEHKDSVRNCSIVQGRVWTFMFMSCTFFQISLHLHLKQTYSYQRRFIKKMPHSIQENVQGNFCLALCFRKHILTQKLETQRREKNDNFLCLLSAARLIRIRTRDAESKQRKAFVAVCVS